jgi:hypothetical protein
MSKAQELLACDTANLNASGGDVGLQDGRSRGVQAVVLLKVGARSSRHHRPRARCARCAKGRASSRWSMAVLLTELLTRLTETRRDSPRDRRRLLGPSPGQQR